ncbi:MAG: 1-phosphofructokinase [Butyricicoccus sp.]
MIYTVTFNPSLDYSIRIEDFKTGVLNRTSYEEVRVGGKGVNVSIVLHDLGVENVALGFIAGFTGDQIESGMQQLGCTTSFIHLPSGFSRINVKLAGQEEDLTEMNGMGPAVSKEEYEQFMLRLRRMLKDGDTLVLSGSIPASMPQDTYERILEEVDTDKICVVVDTSSSLLRHTLPYRPFLIKPNLTELSELFGRSLTEYDDIVGCAKHLQEEGARNVLVSMGGEGAILVTEEGQVFSAPAPDGDLVDSIGAGDSMVAGFLAGYMERGSMVDGFAKGIAAGSATAYKNGLATGEEITAVAQRM